MRRHYSLLPERDRKILERVSHALARLLPGHVPEWKEIEYFDTTWKKRIRQMAAYVPPKSVVVDLGCGREWLREYLDDCQYIPVDYCRRSADTLVCDFNRGEFPDIAADVCFVSGCLEYVDQPAWFVDMIASHARLCVLSYCAMKECADVDERVSKGWKNHLTANEVINLFESNAMHLREASKTDTGDLIFCFATTD